MNREQICIEDYIKERIISEFEAYILLTEGVELTALRGSSKPILTTSMGTEDEFIKFCLTNVTFFSYKSYNSSLCTIDGLISTLNGGRIIICEYDIKH